MEMFRYDAVVQSIFEQSNVFGLGLKLLASMIVYRKGGGSSRSRGSITDSSAFSGFWTAKLFILPSVCE